MSLWDAVSRFLAIEPLQERSIDSFDTTTPLAIQLAALHAQPRPWRLPTITEALGVPAIQRAVTLIANTTGSLALQTFRNTELMSETPRVIIRPNPYEAPNETYGAMAYCLATRGETVLWIAARDSYGFASALVVLPLGELRVEENPRNRLLPFYTWGTIKGTRYSPANPTGDFVHITYLREPFALRGMGPLQLARAAASVSVESQEWAANFYAGGGYPSIELHSEVELSVGEADALKLQWIGTPSNMPKVTSGNLAAREIAANPQGAQMLEAREYQNGDAARMFGIPGALMEYNSPGSSLTYQNVTEVYTIFVKGSLSINYLEKIEQALTDLLPRPMAVRFYLDGLMRADVKTRWEVYEKAVGVLGPEEGAAFARLREGLVPGNIENAPVPAAPPLAIPAPLQNRSQEAVRCEGMRLLRGRLTSCGKLLAEAGPFVGTCPRCGKVYTAVAVMSAPRTSLVPVAIRARTLAVQDIIIPEPPEEDRIDRLAVAMAGMAEAMTTMATREAPTPAPPQVTIAEGAIQVHVDNAPPVVNVSAPIEAGAVQVHNAPPVVNVTTPIESGAVQVNLPTQPVTVERPVVNVPPSVVDVTVDSSEFAAAIREMQGALTPRPMDRTVDRDSRGLIVRVHETPKEEIA